VGFQGVKREQHEWVRGGGLRCEHKCTLWVLQQCRLLWINGVALDAAGYLVDVGLALGAGVDLEFYLSELSPNGAFVASDTSDGGVLLMRVP
jgi:hypothetical protein